MAWRFSAALAASRSSKEGAGAAGGIAGAGALGGCAPAMGAAASRSRRTDRPDFFIFMDGSIACRVMRSGLPYGQGPTQVANGYSTINLFNILGWLAYSPSPASFSTAD